jgi:hypothetical protein
MHGLKDEDDVKEEYVLRNYLYMAHSATTVDEFVGSNCCR